MVRLRSPAPSVSLGGTEYGGFPERPKGADCKSVVTDFGGPNPPSPTKTPARQCGSFTYNLFLLIIHLPEAKL